MISNSTLLDLSEIEGAGVDVRKQSPQKVVVQVSLVLSHLEHWINNNSVWQSSSWLASTTHALLLAVASTMHSRLQEIDR